MAGYAFSHQFYQRWSQAPAQVRAAIVQDLKDIMTLLQTDTTVAEFAFTQPDLDGYLDELYAQDRIQKAADAEAIRIAQEQERVEREALEAQRKEEERLEKEQLEQEQLAQERLEIARIEAEAKQKDYEQAELQRAQQQAEAEQAEQQAAAVANEQEISGDGEQTATLTIVPQLDAETQSLDTVTASTATPNVSAPTTQEEVNQEGVVQENVQANTVQESLIEESVAQEFLSHTEKESAPAEPIALSQEQENFVRELEVRIDDYLSEQMADMSENLKAWLRDEVQRQLARTK
ncbi:hypothetical protein PSAR109036_08160 [Psychrobacter arenosus]|uniref:hypothetical protein n=1 Tax=Psychrobacter arenosus TaxID=256326 RepID=UPI00191B8080|nr:hypothetical protein [Psychrobacter arenosus]